MESSAKMEVCIHHVSSVRYPYNAINPYDFCTNPNIPQ